MLNKSFIGIEGLGRFRDRLLVESISDSNQFTAVPSGTIAKSYLIYYSKSGNIFSIANPQPAEGSTIPANTYYVINGGSHDDITRAPSVAAITNYVDSEVEVLESSVTTALGGKVSSVSLDASHNKLYYNTGNSTEDIVTFAGSGATSVSSDSSTKTVTISSSDTHYTATPVLASTKGGTSNATSNASNPYLNIVENSAKSGGIQIEGGGATTVTAKSGILTISSTDTINFAGLASGESSGGKAAAAAAADYATSAGSASTATTQAVGTNNTSIATTAFVKAEIDSVLQASDAMRFKGTLGTGGNITSLPNTHSQGDTYRVITANTYAGVVCEVGDLIICLKDGTTASNSDWTVVQTNIDGAVTGPTSSVNNRVAIFNGTSGKIIKDSGYTISKSVPSNAVFTDTTNFAGLAAGESSGGKAATAAAADYADTSTTRTAGDNSTYIATTAFVQTAVTTAIGNAIASIY